MGASCFLLKRQNVFVNINILLSDILKILRIYLLILEEEIGYYMRGLYDNILLYDINDILENRRWVKRYIKIL